MDLKQLITIAIQVLTWIPTPTGTVSALKSLAIAIANSPEFLTLLQSLLTKQQAIPNGALGEMAIDSADPELQAAWKASPLLHHWASDHQAKSPPGTEAFGIGGIAALITYLPMLLKLMPQIQQIITWLQSLQPKPTA